MPTIDKDDKPAIEHSAAGDVMDSKGVSEHRRKLIKLSAAAVPAIMTLRSGAAVALASANLCLAADARKLADEPPALVLTKEDARDAWVRVWGVEVTLEDAAGNKTTYICVKKGSGGAWECWDTDGRPATVDISPDQISKGKKVSLLGYFDGVTGNFTFHPKNRYVSDQMASPISYSCLCSLHPEMELCKWG